MVGVSSFMCLSSANEKRNTNKTMIRSAFVGSLLESITQRTLRTTRDTFESRLEGGEYANLKFINFKHHYKPELALDIKMSLKERAKTNHEQMKSVTRWFVLPRFGSCKPTPRRGGHKDRVSFNPFPLSNGHLDRVSFSPQSIGTLSPHKDHHTIDVSYFDYKCLKTRMGRRKAIQAIRTQMNTNDFLSQATKSLKCVWDLERIWSLLLYLGVKSRALVLNVMAKNLDALKYSGWGYL
jgi:hypothetical protein